MYLGYIREAVGNRSSRIVLNTDKSSEDYQQTKSIFINPLPTYSRTESSSFVTNVGALFSVKFVLDVKMLSRRFEFIGHLIKDGAS